MIARRHTPAQKVPSTLPPYEYNLKNLSEWVQLAGAKYNALLNLGLSEGIKYSEIATGKANPARDETDDIAKMRAIKLRSYYYKFVRDYNFYINTDEPKKYNADLLKLHNDHFHSKKAKDFLPTFEENIDNRQIDDYAVSMPPKLFSNYLLERLLAGRMIAIHKAAPDKQKDAAAALIKYFTNVLIARDLMMSPPEVRIFKRDGDESSESESSAGTEEFSSMGSSTSSSDGTGTATSESDDSAENAADIVYTRENYDLEDEFEYDDD
jgi:hypothetical protein